mmetsp:Transcript_21659/g.19208  ORF Transcript_21659/g.19208 Transcript_21659/m.19208 type:complete len:148 (-) Transcript_21659:35-478(-)
MKDQRDSSILQKILASKQASREGTFRDMSFNNKSTDLCPIQINKRHFDPGEGGMDTIKEQLSRVASGDLGSCSGTNLPFVKRRQSEAHVYDKSMMNLPELNPTKNLSFNKTGQKKTQLSNSFDFNYQLDEVRIGDIQSSIENELAHS